MNVVFFRNDYAKDVGAAYCLSALIERPNTQVWQYCPFDLSGINLPPGDPLFSPHLQHHQIRTPAEFRRKLDAGEFDLIILMPDTNWRRTAFVRWAQYLLEMPLALPQSLYRQRWRLRMIPEPLFAHVPSIVLDMSDAMTMMPRETALLTGERLYFKREIPYDRNRLFPGTGTQKAPVLRRIQENLRSLPLGISNARYEGLAQLRTEEKEFDVFWAGGLSSNTMRPEAADRLREIGARRGWNICAPEGNLPFAEFGQLMARSKVTLSVAGNGWDCYRHAEAVATGSLPLMNRPTVDMPAWQDLPEELFFENHFANFEDQLAALIAAPESQRAKLLACCDQRVRERCLWSASMEFVLAETRKRHPTLPA